MKLSGSGGIREQVEEEQEEEGEQVAAELVLETEVEEVAVVEGGAGVMDAKDEVDDTLGVVVLG